MEPRQEGQARRQGRNGHCRLIDRPTGDHHYPFSALSVPPARCEAWPKAGDRIARERARMTRLAGKKAVVLGAAGRNNMAQAIARRFAEEGATLVVAGRQEEELKRFAAEIGGHHVTCDITRKADTDALAAFAVTTLGGLDIAVNATGWGLLKPFLETSEDELQRMADLQFKGPFLFFQSMVAAMPGGGSLIQISSATATIMLNDHAAYMGTKAGTDHVM